MRSWTKRAFARADWTLVVAGCLVAATLACKKARSLAEVAPRHLEAWKECNLEAIREGVTEETRAVLEVFYSLQRVALPPELRNELTWERMICPKDAGPGFQIRILEVKVDGDRGVVEALTGPRRVEFLYKRENGEWKVDVLGMIRSAARKNESQKSPEAVQGSGEGP